MHFWIDKRSQQCGFGRSRVAASLSGASSSGLSFGHPPRRISGGSKSNNRNALPDCHHSNATGSGSSSSSRNHQYQHQHPHQQHQHQHPQQLQQQQHACNNNNFNIAHNYQPSHGQSSNTSNYTSNINIANTTANAAAAGAASATATTNGVTMPTATAVTLNNNPHQHVYQQAHLNAANVGIRNHQNVPGNIHVVNNNNATNSTTCTPLPATTTPHNLNQRGDVLLQGASAGTSNIAAYQQHANQCYDMRNYHHPQFGNMSVRHYQQQAGRSSNGPTHASVNSSVHGSYRSGSTRAIVGTTAAAPALTAMQQQQQHMNQMPYRQHGYSHSSAATGQSNESIMGGSAPICTNTTNTTSYAVANTAHRYSSAAINMRTSNMTIDTGGGGGDAQLLPSHLKCGMCASLVLASVFVAGAKFYLDHQGTGLEVLIFCAFSATFFLAACTVSLCRVPKGLLPSGRNAVLGTQHHSDADSVMHCARAPYGRRDIASGDGGVGGGGGGVGGGGGELLNSDDIHGAPLCGQLQLIEDSANAGPPPYHIAIYFPESENSSKSKETTFEDESPPPSYDKILI